jgi:DNA (cytosine-5)-methyltransferase 1
MRALDLFCCAGGATKGLQRAGFHVTGVDIKPQSRYCGDAFVRGDALRLPFDLREFDFVWASPPCQAFTRLRNLQRTRHGLKRYPDIIHEVRQMLAAANVPYVIENLEGAPLAGDYLIMLCGTMFGLQTPNGSAELRRHRLFETSFSIPLRPRCQHVNRAISITGHTPQTNVVTNRIRRTFPIGDAKVAMGIDWMPMKYLSQAIPPAYSEFIGRQAMDYLQKAAA